jgi:DNA modification methylase
MADKRAALAVLNRAELGELAQGLGLVVASGVSAEDLGATIAGSPAATLERILGLLPKERGQAFCTAYLGSSAVPAEVEPRKPRLVWQGMDRRELAVSVPTQVVEIVRPGRAVDHGDSLPLSLAQTVEARDGGASADLPPNRLIWTNDNLVALQTLLDERDPRTRDYRYRGKVDLVYIDPPFMVNNDFLASNAIDIELDGEADMTVQKEPSLVEILAYRDTWRQGLDTFLSMLRRRLELLKELLAPTGTIYVHLDWHAAHYVKVLMDEVFGYDSFRNEIVWHYYNKMQGNVNRFASNHDVILAYQNGGAPYFAAQVEARDRPETQLVRAWDPEKQKLVNAKGPDGKVLYQTVTTKTVDDVWRIPMLQPADQTENMGYPTQKRRAILERIIASSCPPGGLVLDCFMGSGTTCEAAERLGRRFIGIDNGKYAVHLARKRLIQLHGQPRPPEKAHHEYSECEHCKNIERKEKRQKSPGPFQVRAFTVENMGVYQRAEQWQDFQTQRTKYRDEMIKVFGGEPVDHSPLLHGFKGASWVHVGPLDGPVSSAQVWSIARAARDTHRKAVTILSADFDTLSGSEKDDIKGALGVSITVRVIPQSAIDEVRRRIELIRKANGDEAAIESMAIPAFYAPLSIRLNAEADGRLVRLDLSRCEIDIESFLTSQQPALKPITDKMSAAAKKRAQAEADKWAARQQALLGWLDKADTWKKFIDFWAIDWDYGRRVGHDGKPIFVTDWQSFRVRKSKSQVEDLVFTAEFRYAEPGHYRVAARVTDVFGNDGIATVNVEVR